jgi:hypothetical protein
MAGGQEPGDGYQLSGIGFWNVENLYDTINDRRKDDDDFTPAGQNAWTGTRYWTKIDRLAEVIALLGTEYEDDGLALLGLCEIENKQVLADLVNSPRLKKRGFQFVHIDGPDARGVDPALLYNPGHFKITGAKAFHLKVATDTMYATRDILLVTGLLTGEPLAVLVNHWPSRRGGERQSRPNRIAAAKLTRKIADSIGQTDPAVKIVIMGDLNDDPTGESVKKHIGTFPDASRPVVSAYFNPMEKPYKQGVGTLAWRDSWNLFDQVLLNRAWLQGAPGWRYRQVIIFDKTFLKTEFGNFSGYPFRTYSGGVYTAGYSDHFPVYIIIERRAP